jgi:hypothetical protein
MYGAKEKRKDVRNERARARDIDRERLTEREEKGEREQCQPVREIDRERRERRERAVSTSWLTLLCVSIRQHIFSCSLHERYSKICTCTSEFSPVNRTL